MKQTNRSSRLRQYCTFLHLDQYVFANFLPSFLLTLLTSAVIFVALWWILSALGVNWSLGDAFIQLTNPSTSADGEDGASALEWIAVIILNLFGLFILNGVILTLLVNWVSNRKDRHLKGDARYNNIFKRNFAVIIGGHEIVPSLVRDLISKEDPDFILIQTQRDASAVRREIATEINDHKILHRVIIYSGSRTSWHELEELHLSEAKQLFIVGEPSYIDRSSHDSINMLAWNLINSHIRETKDEKIDCHIMFEYQSTFSAFQFTDLKSQSSTAFRFLPFSLYENWAQQVLICPKVKGKYFYLPLDGPDGLPYSSHQRAHLIIIGMSKMGVAMAIEAAHIAHFPNFVNPQGPKPRTLITFIDRNARKEMNFFMGRFRELFRLARWREVTAPDGILQPRDKSWDIYDTIDDIANRSNTLYPWHNPMKDEECGSPYFGDYLGEDMIDIDFEFIEGDVAYPSVQKYISDACADNSSKTKRLNALSGTTLPDATSKTTIAVCIPNAAEAMSVALYMDKSVYEDAQQIWVLQPESGALIDTIRFGSAGHANEKYCKLRPFGMLEQCDYLQRARSLMPKLISYAYDCLDQGTTLYDEYQRLGEKKLIEAASSCWLAISTEGGKSAVAKRYSNIYCANSFDTKIRSGVIDLSKEGVLTDEKTISALAFVEHNRWIIEQLLLGIRPVDKEYKDLLPIEGKQERAELKRRNIHPDLLSNEKLGATQSYDVEIVKIIPLVIKIIENYETQL